MEFDEYQKEAMVHAKYGEGSLYPFLGLAEEAGEALGKVAKWVRAHPRLEDAREFRKDCGLRDSVAKELGDVLWMVAACADAFGFRLGDVARCNLAKLADREVRGVINGEGDDR